MHSNKQLKAKIFMTILDKPNHQLTRAKLLRHLWYDYKDATEIDEIMNQFIEAGMVIVQATPEIVFTIPEDQAKEFRRLSSGKAST